MVVADAAEQFYLSPAGGDVGVITGQEWLHHHKWVSVIVVIDIVVVHSRPRQHHVTVQALACTTKAQLLLTWPRNVANYRDKMSHLQSLGSATKTTAKLLSILRTGKTPNKESETETNLQKELHYLKTNANGCLKL